MIVAGYSGRFHKQYQRATIRIRIAFKERLKLFLREPMYPVLENHPLKGEWRGYRSINVTGDWRAIFKIIDKETVYFVALGTHGELYGT